MTRLRRHVLAVVAALFALAVGIALGGGPLSYVSGDDGTDSPGDVSEQDGDGSDGPDEVPLPGDGAFADAFAGAAASRLYGGVLLGHPTAIVAMPGVDQGVVDAMVAQVPLAGGGLTGVFEVSAAAADRDETSLVDSLSSQLMTELDDPRIDPAATTYVRLGQLMSLAIATPSKKGQGADDTVDRVRSSLETGGLLTAPPGARLAPLVLVLLPSSEDGESGSDLAAAAIYHGLTTGLRGNAAGVVLLGDTASGEDGLLAELREDDVVTSTLATVDGGDTVIGQVTAMLAVISALDGSVGAYGASGADGAVPLS